MTDTLPEGYLPHDGGHCPVPLDSKPGVIFADGMKYQPGLEPASLWALDNLRGDWWQHTSPNPDFNIIGYKPDPAFVEPGPITEAQSETLHKAMVASFDEFAPPTDPVALLRGLWAASMNVRTGIRAAGLKREPSLYPAVMAFDPIAEAVRVYLGEPKGQDDDR